ncbi:MAG: response regulator [Synergistaceae bacterium]|nr:response regulator [Synergistaceae bacterium]
MDAVLGIVDDDESTLYTVKAMADLLGWSITATMQPKEALEWIRKSEIDILLVDYHMPLMSGIDVIRSARQLSADVVLIALTVEENPAVAANLMIAGADDFVSKPIRLADFSSRILLHSELLKYRVEEHWQERSKGLSEKTARRVLQLFSNREVRLTTGEAAETASLSYPAMHRYLEYLVKKGQLQRITEYENVKSGRPKNVYFKPDQ